MRKILLLLCAVILSVGSYGADVVPANVPDGDYVLMVPNHGAYAYYDGTNAYLRRTSDYSISGSFVFTFTQGTGENAGKYTIKIGEKYMVAGSSLSWSGDAGVNLKVVDESEATDSNKWWVIGQDESNVNYVDIYPYQENITTSTPSWNFSSGSNQAVGFYEAVDPYSQWVMLSPKRVISLNFNSGQGNAQLGEGPVNVKADAWNNFSAASNTRSDLVTWNGSAAETLSPNWSVTWSAPTNWYYTSNIKENILKGYLDEQDANQATISFSNLPFTSGYDVYVIKAADTDAKFSAVTVTIGDKTYTYTSNENGVGVFGEDQWGASHNATSVLGTNVICIKGLTATNITVKGGKRNAGRGAVAAVQIVETGVNNFVNVEGDTYDARYITSPVYLQKSGDLTIKIPYDAFPKEKYFDVSGVTGTVTYIHDDIMQAQWDLKERLANVVRYVGTKPGQYTTNATYAAAIAMTTSTTVTESELLAEIARPLTEYYSVNMPQEGVGYLISNRAYPSYYLTSNSDKSKLANLQTPSPVYFEAVDGETNQFYIKIDGKYLGQCYISTDVALTDDKANAYPYSFEDYNGYIVLHERVTTSYAAYAYLHAINYGARTVVGWETSAPATQWTIYSAEESMDIAKEKLNQLINSVDGNFGTNPFYYNNTDDSATLNAAKAVNDNGEATVDEICEQVTKLYGFYPTNPFTPGYYRFKNVKRADAYLYSDGSNVKWKAFDENDATMIWHVSAVNGTGLTISNYGDGKIPQSTNFATQITMGDTENTSVVYEIISIPQVKIKFNGAQGACANDNNSVTNYNTGAGENGVWYVERVDYLDAYESLAFAAADKFEIPEGAEVVYPNEFNYSSLTPQSINTALDDYLALENTLAAKKAFVETESGQCLLRYRNLLNDYSSYTVSAVNVNLKTGWGTLIVPFSVARPSSITSYTCTGIEENNKTLTLSEVEGNFVHNTPYIIKGAVGSKYTLIGWDRGSKDNHTNDCLTGVLGTDKKVPAGSYILATNSNTGITGFYKVSTSNFNAGQFKCYLTLSSASSPAFFFPSDDDLTKVDGIEADDNNGSDNAIYNLQGVRVNETVKGQLYIKNHKKFIAK